MLMLITVTNCINFVTEMQIKTEWAKVWKDVLCHFSEESDPAPAKRQKRVAMSSVVQQSGAVARTSRSNTLSSTLRRGSAAPATASRDVGITSAVELARARTSSTAGPGVHVDMQTRSSEVDFPSLLRRADSPPVS